MGEVHLTFLPIPHSQFLKTHNFVPHPKDWILLPFEGREKLKPDSKRSGILQLDSVLLPYCDKTQPFRMLARN